MRALRWILPALWLGCAGAAPAQQAGHDHGEAEAPAAQPAGEHAGHDPASRAGEHAAHATHAPKVTPVPALTEADRAAARAPAAAHDFHDNDVHSFLLLEQLEAWRDGGVTGVGWEARGWIGTDLTRIWIRSEGERMDGHTESADLELLYGRTIAPWWDVVAGLRHDFAPGNGQSFAALGIQGLAPQRFELEATAYFGEGGQTALRFGAERELLITNRLIAQPLLEVNVFGKDDARRGIGAGLSSAEAGLRLRYEFTRRFAPYLGIGYERTFGETADLRRAGGQSAGDLRYVAGLRTWF